MHCARPAVDLLRLNLCLMFAARCVAPSAPAQATSIPFVYHIYVDPIYGDDVEAYNRNPPTASIFSQHPVAGFRVARNAGFLSARSVCV